jgi:fructose-1,6-bisphosphatase/inositol monophosphatase family enzyme
MSERSPSLISIIKQAGDALMSLWPGSHTPEESLNVTSKNDGTVVSQADMRSNAIVLGGISTLYPGDAILSEESPHDVATLKKASRVWVVDPLDGTSSFIAGRDDFSILVALVENNRPTYGVMYFPARKLLVTAERGKGAQCNGEALRVSSATEPSRGRVYIRNFECRRPEVASPMMDSGLAFLKVASGELDGAIIRMTTHREWDIAAPMAVLLEAGGMVTDETGAPIKCGTGELTYKFVVASNTHSHQQLQALIP